MKYKDSDYENLKENFVIKTGKDIEVYSTNITNHIFQMSNITNEQTNMQTSALPKLLGYTAKINEKTKKKHMIKPSVKNVPYLVHNYITAGVRTVICVYFGCMCPCVSSSFMYILFYGMFLLNVRNYHECEGRIEKSVQMIAVWHYEACRVMTNGDPPDGFFHPTLI